MASEEITIYDPLGELLKVVEELTEEVGEDGVQS